MRKLMMWLGTLVSSLFMTAVAFAGEGAASDSGNLKSVLAISAGLAIAVAAFGGALGQSRAAAAALEGIARNPAKEGSIKGFALLGMALAEFMGLLAFVVAILILYVVKS